MSTNNGIYKYITESRERLDFLADELAINYFNAAIPDDYSEDDVINDLLKNDIFNRKDQQKFTTSKFFEEDREFEGAYKKTVPTQDIGIKATWARNILIIGAGCTNDSFKGIPLGKEAIKILYNIKVGEYVSYSDANPEFIPVSLQELIDGFDVHQDKFDVKHGKHYKNKSTFDRYTNATYAFRAIAKKHHIKYGMLKLYTSEIHSQNSEPDFETSLHLLSELIPTDEIRNRINQIYNHRFGPTLFYEIVAHMLKHRIIDIVINFNFDELLDRAIEDELGHNCYHKILSDGDCKDFQQLLIGNKLKQPIYIKPHGTASHKSTLRYTKEHYYDIPKDISKLLEEIFSEANIKDVNDKKIPLCSNRINLIVVGFDMASIEINSILSRRLPSGSKIFYFNYTGSNDEKSIQTSEQRIKDRFHNIFQTTFTQNNIAVPDLHIINHTLFDSYKNEPTSPLGGVFCELFDFLCSRFNDEYSPSKIARHKIICKIFGFKEYYETYTELQHSIYFSSVDYLLDRTIIEILIAIFRSKGVIDSKELLSGKAGTYFSLYEAKSENETISFRYILSLTNPQKEIQNIFSPIQYRDIVNAKDHEYHYCFEQLIANVKQILSPSLLRHLKNFEYSKINHSLKNIYTSNTPNIKPNFSEAFYHIFLKHSEKGILHTKLALDYYIGKAVQERKKSNDLTVLLMIAESGYYHHVFQKEMAKYDKAIFILADYIDYDNIDGLSDRVVARDKKVIEYLGINTQYPQNNKTIIFMKPVMHNHHFTLFFNSSKSVKTGKGVYYYQDRYSNIVNPISVEEKENIISLLDLFEDYGTRALQSTTQIADLDVANTKKLVNETVKELKVKISQP